MKYGIDYRPALLSRSGIGRYAREITAAMDAQLGDGEELRLFAACHAAGDRLFADAPGGLSARSVLARRRFPARLLQLLGRLGIMSAESFTGPVGAYLHTDLVFAPVRAAPQCVMVHDLAFMRSDGYHRLGFGRAVWKRMAPVLDAAAAILAPSPATALDLRRHAPAAAARAVVIPHGGDHLLRFAGAGKQTDPGRRPYLLAVGTLEPRKNWERTLRAFESIAGAEAGTDLVFAGQPGWMCDDFLASLRASPASGRIHLMSEVDDAGLADLYSCALALVYPSLWEGFGLPVAEALSLGCPVLTSAGTAPAWVAGAAALLVDPEDEAAIAAAMLRLIREEPLRADLAAAGRERAQEFTWKKAAAATLQILRGSTRS